MVEMDSQLVHHAIVGSSSASAFGLIVDDVKALATKFEKIDFKFVKQSKNNVAHILFRDACSSPDCTE